MTDAKKARDYWLEASAMTPMTLERALEVAIKCSQLISYDDMPQGIEGAECDQAAAVLRAFMEKGLPTIRAADRQGMRFKPTPDLTEALARLKALEEELLGTKHGIDYSVWADEIAAIRKALGAND